MVHGPREQDTGLKAEITNEQGIGLKDGVGLTIKRKGTLFTHTLQKGSNISNKDSKLRNNLGNRKHWTVNKLEFAENFQLGIPVSTVWAKQDHNKSRL